METKLCILMNCFFNVDHIDRTLKSIENTNYPCDIVILENPSKYSLEIYQMLKKYKIHSHFLANENIEGHVFQLFYNTHRDFLSQYKYIAMTESDVVLDKGALHEITSLLDNSSDDVGLASIDLQLDTKKYHNLPIKSWVPTPQFINGYLVGHTGFQFITFKSPFLDAFMEKINNKEIVGNVALGSDSYNGISDENLNTFTGLCKRLWIRTVENKLDHIGWEHYIENNSEYVQLKKENIKNKKIRQSLELSQFTLTKVY